MSSRILLAGGLLILIFSCRQKQVIWQQYMAQGESLYNKNCSNCHQKEGTGLGKLYPPLQGSDYLAGNLPTVLCMMKYGNTSQLTVNGVYYNMKMKGNPTLTDLELAEIATYVYNRWGGREEIVSTDSVTRVIDHCVR